MGRPGTAVPERPVTGFVNIAWVELGACLVSASLGLVALLRRWRRERAAWLGKEEHLRDEIWELRSAAAALDKGETLWDGGEE